MKCRVCGDVRRPKTSLVQGTVAQLRQLQRVISDLKLKKDELSHEIEVCYLLVFWHLMSPGEVW
jgi:hypothetical protein